jgi:CRP-like cAMP-binding protein
MRLAQPTKNFLAKVGGGKTILKCHKDEIVFSQGDVSDAIFYIQKGKIKLTVISERGKEAVVGLIGAIFRGKLSQWSSTAHHNGHCI